MKIGIQGGPASYHEAAVKQIDPRAEVVYCATFTELFKAITDGAVDSGVTAIANNRVQFIADPYEYLTAPDAPYQIVAETYLRIEHALLARKGATLADITEVHSQAPALGQCSHFLEDTLPQAHIIEESDTALAAKIVATEGKLNSVAIASKAAGELYGLEVLQESVQDDPDNLTRFVQVTLKDHANSVDKASKTTMMLQTPQVPGALVKALLPFQKANINLTSLQSKLIPNTPFDMQFFVEFEAGLQEEQTKRVLQNLESNGYRLHILGSYRKADIPIKK